MEKRMEQVLRRAGVYAPMKSSLVYETYLRTFRRDVLRDRHREIEFYRRLVGNVDREITVYDVGANLGDKAEVFRRIPARVVCFEPDRTNIEFLRQRFRNRPEVMIVGKALSDRVGTAEFHVFEEGDAFNTLSPKWADAVVREVGPRFGLEKNVAGRYNVDTVTLDQAFAWLGRPDYLKIDVEGHELQVLLGMSEVPPVISYEANLPTFRREAMACLDRLASLAPTMEFNYDVHGQLESPRWLNAADMRSWLEKTDLVYFEVWGRR
jgi:FkbM family methyltransferase